jgi:hypothetical protein
MNVSEKPAVSFGLQLFVLCRSHNGVLITNCNVGGQLKCDGTRAETRFRLSVKRTSPFKSAGASVQPITGSRGVRIIGSNAGYTMFRGSVKGSGYPLHSPVSPSLPLPCVTVCHHISTGLYYAWAQRRTKFYMRHLKLLGAKFHTEDPQTLGVTAQN